MRSYAIGDIHGHIGLLKAAHQRIAADRRRTGDSESPVIHLGDLVDRGPDSRAVIDYLMEGQARGEPWVVLKGNHDRMFTAFLDDPEAHDPCLRPDLGWLNPRLGGNTTLASYGVQAPDERPVAEVHADALAAVPQAHNDWMKLRPTSHVRGDLWFVHAGIRPGVALEDQTEDDLCWIRKGFLEDPRDHGALIVHGHTALEAPHHYGNRVNLDSSAAYGGPLTAAVFEGRDVFILTDTGREPLLPAADYVA